MNGIAVSSPAGASARDGSPDVGPSVSVLAGRIARFAIPTTAIMLLSSLSLVVDTYFVTKLGSLALAGVSFVFPLYLTIVMAFGGGIGVGLSVVISVRLGRRDLPGAQRTVGSAFALALGLSALFAVGFLLGGHALFGRIAAEGAVRDAAMSFARPLFLGSPLLAISLTMTNLLRSEKRVGAAASMLLVGGLVNAILNPILIHGLFGAPRLAVAGSAWATVLGFVASGAMGGLLLGGPDRLSLRLRDLSVDLDDVGAIVRIALPTLATYVATNGVLLSLTTLWGGFGTDALASFGLSGRLEYLIAIAVYGVGGAIMTLGGEAWGARRADELARICRVCGIGVFVATSLLSAALVLRPAAWFGLFEASPGAVAAGSRYLRLAALGYPFYALALTLNYGYQTVARAYVPLLLSLGRGFLVAVPVAAVTVALHGSLEVAAGAVAVSFVVQGLLSLALLPGAIAGARPPSLEVPQKAPDSLPRLRTLERSGASVSPYPLGYTLRWPWYFRRPSMRNHSGIGKLPTRFVRPGVAPQPTVRVCAIGDIMVMQGDRIPSLSPELTRLLSGADLIIGCCESPIGRPDCDPERKHSFLFNMPRDYLRGIIEASGAPASSWYLTVANNHVGDVGPEGLGATLRYLSRLGVNAIGARHEGESADGRPSALVVVERKSLRIGVAAWTHWMNVASEGVWRSSEVADVPWRDLRAEHRVDCLLGDAHWEYEWQHFPRRETRDLARRLATAGFDAIFGSHPHVLQPFEWHGDSLCAYSLGNFCSGLGPAWPARMCTVLTLELGTRGEHRGKIVGYELHLFAQLDDGKRVSLVPVPSAPEELRARIEERVSRLFLAAAR